MTCNLTITQKPDFALLASLYAVCFEKAWNEAELVALFATAETFAIMNEQAFLIVRLVLDEAEIITLGVLPSARKQGIAFKLMQVLKGFLIEQGIKTLFLETKAGNFAAQRLYQKAGFATIALRKGYYHNQDGTVEDAMMMVLTLSEDNNSTV